MNPDIDEQPADVPATPAAEQGPVGPGALIRAARERAHLSVDELSAQTKLARHTLEALERDDFNSLLEPVYVRGYYRKCAKVLGVSELELLDAYQARVEPRAPAAPSKLRLASGTELGSASRLPIALAIFVAVVAVVVCAFLWFWRSGHESVPASIANRAGTATEPAPAPESPEGGLPEASSPLLPSVTETSGTAEPSSTPAEVPAPTVEAPKTEAPKTEAPKAPPAPVTAGGNGTIVLTVNATSWVRVNDAGGKTLFNALVNAGEVKELSGTPPLSVFLGNAPGVKVEYQGQAVDFGKTVKDNNTARFTLPLTP